MKTNTTLRSSLISSILALAALVTPSCITVEGLGQRGFGQILNGVNPTSIGACGVGQMLDRNGQVIIDHRNALNDAMNNMDNLSVPAPIIYPSPAPTPYYPPVPTYSVPSVPYTTGTTGCGGTSTCPNTMW